MVSGEKPDMIVEKEKNDIPFFKREKLKLSLCAADSNSKYERIRSKAKKNNQMQLSDPI